MPADGPNKDQLGSLHKEASRRFEDAFQRQRQIHHDSSSQNLVAYALVSEARKIVASPSLHPDFEERFKWFVRSDSPMPKSERFTAYDGTVWEFDCFPGRGVSLRRFDTSEDQQGEEFEAFAGDNRLNPPVTKYSKGRIKFEEGRGQEMLRRIEHEGAPITYPTDIGWRGMFLLMEMEEAMKHQPLPYKSPPLNPNYTPPEPRMIEPSERRALGGELDESINEGLRMGDLLPSRAIDREDPKRRLSKLCDEAEAWVEWQEDHPFVDQEGKEHIWKRGNLYYYATRDEEGRDVRLEARGGYDRYRYSLDVRELRGERSGSLTDMGQATIYQLYRGRHAQWREPGIADNQPPSLEIFNEKGVDPNARKALNKASRAYSMLHDGRLIGYRSETGGFVPGHRVSKAE